MPEEKFTFEQITPFRWKLPRNEAIGMRVPGEVIASKSMISRILSDRTPQQVANVATMPGIVGASMAMPDIHWGYGFPIGGVAAFDLDDGVISPGGVGYDINCGVSLLRSDIEARDVKNQIPQMVDALFNKVPCGVGSEGRIKLSNDDFKTVLEKGAQWVVEHGFGDPEDLDHMEENGAMTGGAPSLISQRAYERGRKQLGTLGSGNHFLEIQEVVEIFHPQAAETFGLFKGQLVVMVHSGSRGFGHQVCDDSLKVMQDAVRRYGIDLPDRQLACAPIGSPEGLDYFSMMKCAANYAWGNRLALVGLTRQAFASFFNKSWRDLGMGMVWDVAHNIAKIEPFDVGGKKKDLCVHRKGATRAFGAGHDSLPADYRDLGQPVIIPGDMGTASYVLLGTNDAEKTTFSSTCHGAGRLMSRKEAVRKTRGQDIVRMLAKKGVSVRARGKFTLNEEVPEAYKNVTEVVDAVHGAGISLKVARMKPLGTVKG